jgi:hypothetical protein
MRARLRKVLLLSAVAGIVALLALEPGRDKALAVSPPGGDAAPKGDPFKASPARLDFPGRRAPGSVHGDLFGSPPAPPQPGTIAAPPLSPAAPPVPYRFAGIFRSGAEKEVLISKGDVVIAIKEGDTLDGTYRVTSIGAERIELVYLPLGATERILVSSILDLAEPAKAAAPAQPSAAPVAEGGPAQLSWEGPQRVTAGASFTVALRVSTQEPLRAAPMQLRFEPALLEALSVRPGKFFGQGSFSYRVSPDGAIFVGASSSGAAPGTDAELVVVTFRPLKAGATAELKMTALSLQGAAGRAVAHEQLSPFRTAIQ